MPDSTLPGDVRATIGRRVELLADDTRRMLAAASVFGRRFDVAPLAAAVKLDPDVVTAALREAVAAEVVVDDGGGHYTFAHALIEDTLYDSLTPARRDRLHRAAAEALEDLGADDPPLAAIAYHYCRALPAGDRARAVEYACRAGNDAAARGAPEQAIQHFERAREAAAGGEVGTLDAVGWDALLCDLGDAYDHAGQTEAAQATFAEAVDLATLCNDTIGLARSVLGLMGGVDETVGFNLTGTDGALVAMLDDIRVRLPEHEVALRALVTARVAGARYDAGEVERAQELSIEALDLARTSGDAHAIAIAVAVRHTVLSCPEALEDRLQLDAELRALGRSFSVQAEVWRVGDLLECGRLEEADRAMDEMERGLLTSTLPRAAYYVALYRALRAQINGLVDEAGRRCEEARAIGAQVGARRAGLSYAVQSLFVARERRELDGLVELLDALAAEHPNQPGFLTTAAWVRIETGRFDEARVQFDAIAADGFDSLLRNGVWLPNIRLLSEIACALETPGPAARIYELMLPYRDRYIVTSRVLSFLGSVEHSLGALSITTGDLDRADAHLAQARANHVGLGAPLLVARTDLAIAALREARGDAAGARELRARLHEEGLANGWLDLAADATAGAV